LASIISICNLHVTFLSKITPRYFAIIYEVKVKVKVTLRLMVSQSVSLSVKSHLGHMTRYLLLFDSYGLGFLGRRL
jgi:hypothetical protein